FHLGMHQGKKALPGKAPVGKRLREGSQAIRRQGSDFEQEREIETLPSRARHTLSTPTLLRSENHSCTEKRWPSTSRGQGRGNCSAQPISRRRASLGGSSSWLSTTLPQESGRLGSALEPPARREVDL